MNSIAYPLGTTMTRAAEIMTSQSAHDEGVFIASFDSGGPGSVSQLLTMKEVAGKMSRDLDIDVDKLFPADYFDMMGGVGFGGICALLLGRLHMTPDEAMDELTAIADAIFPNVPEELVTPAANTARLRKSIVDMLRRHDFPVDIKLNDTENQESRCKVVVFAATDVTMGYCHSFRSYPSREIGAPDCTFVEAACAVLADPERFSPVPLGRRGYEQEFTGTPFGFSNPMRAVLEEARLLFGNKRSVSFLLSLGAGRPAPLTIRLPSLTSFNHFTSLTHAIWDSERVAHELSNYLSDVEAYLRLSVDRGMEEPKISDWHRLGPILSHTHVYLRTVSDDIDTHLQLARQRTSLITLEQLNRASRVATSKVRIQQPMHNLEMQFKDLRDIVQQSVEKITLIDAIGSSVAIPLEYCRTYKMLDDMVKFYFEHHQAPGNSFVKKGRYKLFFGQDRTSINPGEWTHKVAAGTTVEMSVVVHKDSKEPFLCPRCKTKFNSERHNGWAECRTCREPFQFTADARVAMDPRDDLEHASGAGELEMEDSEQRSQGEENQLEKFRLISVIDSFTSHEFFLPGNPGIGKSAVAAAVAAALADDDPPAAFRFFMLDPPINMMVLIHGSVVSYLR